jgi:hypothetical protein
MARQYAIASGNVPGKDGKRASRARASFCLSQNGPYLGLA